VCFTGDNVKDFYLKSENTEKPITFYNTAKFTLSNDYSRSISAN